MKLPLERLLGEDLLVGLIAILIAAGYRMRDTINGLILIGFAVLLLIFRTVLKKKNKELIED